jgi:hypothetical protein
VPENQCNPPATTEYDPEGHSKQVEAPPVTAGKKLVREELWHNRARESTICTEAGKKSVGWQEKVKNQSRTCKTEQKKAKQQILSQRSREQQCN